MLAEITTAGTTADVKRSGRNCRVTSRALADISSTESEPSGRRIAALTIGVRSGALRKLRVTLLLALAARASGQAAMVSTAGSSKGGRSSAAATISIARRSEEHTSELQSIMRITYAVFCLTKKKAEYYKIS